MGGVFGDLFSEYGDAVMKALTESVIADAQAEEGLFLVAPWVR